MLNPFSFTKIINIPSEFFSLPRSCVLFHSFFYISFNERCCCCCILIIHTTMLVYIFIVGEILHAFENIQQKDRTNVIFQLNRREARRRGTREMKKKKLHIVVHTADVFCSLVYRVFVSVRACVHLHHYSRAHGYLL